MRLSVYPEKGFRTKRVEDAFRVTMDGRPLDRVVKVDTGAGVAWVPDTDRDGKIRIDWQKEEFILRRVFGPMRIERIER